MKIKLLLLALSAFCLHAHAQNDYIVTTYEETSSTGDSLANDRTPLSPEEAFLEEFFPYKSVCDWEPGMRFLVVPGERDAYIRTFTDSVTSREVGTPSLKFKTLEYRGHEKTSRGWVHMNFYCVEEQKAYYHELHNFSFEEYCQKVQGGGVSGLAYLGDVDRARELLVGKDLWLKSPIVYRDSHSSSEGYVERELKVDTHVRVERVGVGTREYPVKIVFRTDDGQLYYNNVAMSRTNSAMLNEDFITTKAHHYFANAFSLHSQDGTKSAKMSEQMVGKYVTLNRACTMLQGGKEVTVGAGTEFVIQSAKARQGTNYFTLTLTNAGKVFRRDVTFENSVVTGNIDGTDEGYFYELFDVGKDHDLHSGAVSHAAVTARNNNGGSGKGNGSSKSNSRNKGGKSKSSHSDKNDAPLVTGGDFMNLVSGMVSKGMSQEAVRLSKGEPERTHTLYNGGTQWDFFDGTKVQFNSKGIVTRIIR